VPPPRSGPLLAFDTSAAHCAAVLLDDGGAVAGHAHAPMARGQAEALMPLLQGLLADAGLAWGDLAALAVGVGPGNFTGIRIAVAAARGLALALKVPAFGVSGFAALSHGIAAPGAAVLVCLPGPRGMVHALALRDGAPLAPPVAIEAGAPLPDLTPELTAVIGAAGAGLAERLGLPLAPLHPDSAIARQVAAIAHARLRAGDLPDARPAPLYVRPADAAPAAPPPPALPD